MEVSTNRQLTYGRGYVYSIQYHIVWCTKYRKKVLTEELQKQKWRESPRTLVVG